MLQYLRISNLALLDEVTLEFDGGFTAVTGETGAGKSVLLGALSLLAGARSDKTVIRQGASNCEVEAALYFSNPVRINGVLEGLGVPCCEEGVLILRRSIDREKSPRIQINGSLAPLSALQALGEYWIDFHGPGEPQKLFQSHHQLQMLDLYGGLGPIVKEYSDLYVSWRKLLKDIEEVTQRDRLSSDEIAFYQSQIDRIDSVDPSEESINELESHFSRICYAQEIATLSTQLEMGINGDGGVVSSIRSLIRPANELVKIFPSTASIVERLNSLIIEAEDVASEYGMLSEDLENDPEVVHCVQERMGKWLEIKQQYGPTIQAVLSRRRALEEKVALQSDIEGGLEKLKVEVALKEEELGRLTKVLEKKRMESARELTGKVQGMLQRLGFKKARLEIRVNLEKEFNPHGNCNAEFLFAPNVGQELMALNKIASSGETARVMLALKTILAEVDQTPLLVFDEVDANIGGEIASEVAGELRKLSGNHQVLCVTHLPQVAAQAHSHFVVSKEMGLDSTVVSILELKDREERAEELARMLGDRTSKSALSHAVELLGC